MSDTFLIVGLGSIGQRHLECLREISPDAKIIIWRQYHKEAAVPQGADAVVFCLEDALAWQPLAAIVSNPAPMHLEVAIALAEHGIHLLVEKPLSNSLQGVDQLIKLCEEQRLTLMVAYVLRFNESLLFFKQKIQDQLIGRSISVRMEVGQYLPDWRVGVDYKKSVSARRELGGGALLELSHELDYMSWIFGDVYSVQAMIENTSLLDIDVEDLVELTVDMRDDNGEKTIITVHLDMLQRETKRFCRVIGETGTLEWDAVTGTVRQYQTGTQSWKTLFESNNTQRNSMYRAQLTSFLGCICDASTPVITGCDGRKVLELVQAARESASKGVRVLIG